MAPKVFIGSSSEALSVAEAVQNNLQRVAEVVLWNQQGVFRPGRSFLESLLGATEDYEFGVFIFSLDDLLMIRNNQLRSVRDNVIFEFGLFLGKKDPDHVFALVPRNLPDSHMMTDLAGIALPGYDANASNLNAAVGPACNEIAQYIKSASVKPKEKPLLEQILKDVRTLTEMASTRYLGQFPDFFGKHIIPCLENSRSDFYVACDFPTYGSFSAPEVHDRYIKILLEAKRRSLRIRVLFLNKARRDEVTALQLPKTKELWDELISDPTFADKVQAFRRRTSTQIDSCEDLTAQLIRMHDNALSDFQRNIVFSLKQLDTPLPIYLWIADDRRAVFSIPHFEAEPTEHGFETENHDLVASLRRLWERYGQETQPKGTS